MSEEKVHHEIDYIEISVVDMARAQSFYAGAFGWKFTEYGPDYAGIQRSAGGESGGFARVNALTRGGPLVILFSSELEKSAEAVRTNGGTINKEIFSFPGGRRFEFLDSEGNQMAVWTTE